MGIGNSPWIESSVACVVFIGIRMNKIHALTLINHSRAGRLTWPQKTILKECKSKLVRVFCPSHIHMYSCTMPAPHLYKIKHKPNAARDSICIIPIEFCLLIVHVKTFHKTTTMSIKSFWWCWVKWTNNESTI